MPQKNSDKEATLRELREKYDETNCFILPYLSQTSSEQLMWQMKEIRDRNYNQHVDGWGELCQTARKESGYTQKEVAQLLHLSHVSIVQQEQKTGIDQCVDLFYLEAFALIYHTSVFKLLGKTDLWVGCPITQSRDCYENYENIIMGSLFDINSEKKLDNLRTIIMLGKLRVSGISRLAQLIKIVPNLENVLYSNISEHPLRNERQWRMLGPWPLLDPKQRNTKQYSLRYTYMEAWLVMDDLRNQKSPMLKKMAQFAAADTDLLQLLVDIVQKGGFLGNRRQIKKYSVDKYVIRSSEKKKLNNS